MILVLAIVSLVFNKNAAQAQLLAKVQELLRMQGRETVNTLLVHGHRTSSGIFSATAGVIILFLGASGVFQELRGGLTNIWESETKVPSGLMRMLGERVFAFGMVLSLGFVLMVSLLVSAALVAISTFFSNLLPISPWILEGVNFLVSFTGIAVLSRAF